MKWLRVVSIGFLIVVVGVIALTSSDDEPENPASDSDIESRCERVHTSWVKAIEAGLRPRTNALRGPAFTVRSDDYDDVWMIAVEIDGPGIQRAGDVGVWGTNGDPLDSVNRRAARGLIIRANGLAAELSTWGSFVGEGSDLDLQATDDGVDEAAECVEDALS